MMENKHTAKEKNIEEEIKTFKDQVVSFNTEVMKMMSKNDSEILEIKFKQGLMDLENYSDKWKIQQFKVLDEIRRYMPTIMLDAGNMAMINSNAEKLKIEDISKKLMLFVIRGDEKIKK